MIVAHPDDETIWAGGTILSHPEFEWTVVSLCRASDSDRAPRFFRAVQRLGASCKIGDLDDGPEQRPLSALEVQEMIMSLLPSTDYHLILTHGPRGEYTRHRRHEEISRAVAALWTQRNISATEVWMFAYDDGGKQYLPRAIKTAHQIFEISDDVWQEKYRIIAEVYGFAADSFEARATPRVEAFWRFTSQAALHEWLITKGATNENSCSL
ncbi:MAG: PIG-L family deacetylase [Thermodesulfobacteriota bacterium]|nr:PIG-L family deacetylase [Thermodesulfobacteriota bacterium]